MNTKLKINEYIKISKDKKVEFPSKINKMKKS
jgi:hypothetical protein